jgi:hypothetical protein
MGDPFKTAVRVEAEPIDLAVNNWQLRWATMLATLLQEVAAAKAAAAAEAAAAAAAAAAVDSAAGADASAGEDAGGGVAPPTITASATDQAAREPAGVISAAAAALEEGLMPGGGPGGPLGADRISPYKVARPATKALGVFGRVWDMVDEAQYLESAIEGKHRTLCKHLLLRLTYVTEALSFGFCCAARALGVFAVLK